MTTLEQLLAQKWKLETKKDMPNLVWQGMMFTLDYFTEPEKQNALSKMKGITNDNA